MPTNKIDSTMPKGRASKFDRIYLHDFSESIISWCADKQSDEDLEYIRADLVDNLIEAAEYVIGLTNALDSGAENDLGAAIQLIRGKG